MGIDIITIDETEPDSIELSRNKYSHQFSSICLFLFTMTILYFGLNKPPITARIVTQYSPYTHNKYICSIHGDKWIVLTTTSYPTLATHKFLNLSTHWNLVVVANHKTPQDWLTHITINTSRLLFLTLQQQTNLTFRILNYLSNATHTRKNLGYLIAIKCGAKIIYEVDDDYVLQTNDIDVLPKVLPPQHLPWITFHRQRSSFINIYASFGHRHICPRGFPPDQHRNVTEDGWYVVRKNHQQQTNAYIQQYLVDLDPSVDTIYCSADPTLVKNIEFDRTQSPIGVEPFTFSPYTTQNTITHYEAFWGLYLPITATYRVCDIWRGYWVQRLLWDIDGRLIYSTSTMKHHGNSQSYTNDTNDEYRLKNQSSLFVDFLRSWSSSHNTLTKRISQLAKDVGEGGFWDRKEAEIMNAWLSDLDSVGYIFPAVVKPSSSSSLLSSLFFSRIVKKRAAICVTGLSECINEAWTPSYDIIRSHIHGDIDTFLFLSSSVQHGPIPLDTRLKQVRSYMNSTVTILYDDRLVDPKIPPTCKTFYDPPIRSDRQGAYYQQLWALSECYDLVREYEQKMNIRYELLIRARSDSVLAQVPKSLLPPRRSTIIIPDERHSGGYNDRFAIGRMTVMEKYMRRWHSLSACHSENIHPESFLKLFLNRFRVKVQLIKTLSYPEKPHAHGQCH